MQVIALRSECSVRSQVSRHDDGVVHGEDSVEVASQIATRATAAETVTGRPKRDAHLAVEQGICGNFDCFPHGAMCPPLIYLVLAAMFMMFTMFTVV
jgi:hypothetical protein